MPLVSLLSSDHAETQEAAVRALLEIATQSEARDAVVRKLVAVLDVRNAAAQMKSCEVHREIAFYL